MDRIIGRDAVSPAFGAAAMVFLATVAAGLLADGLNVSRLVVALPTAALAGAGAFAWFRVVYDRPVDEVIRTARRFVAGDATARAGGGGPGARGRLLVAAVNAALERTHRAGPVDGEDERSVGDVIEAIRSLGQGDLRGPTRAFGGVFEPIGRAVAEVRRQLRDRTEALHESAVAVAEEAASLLPYARRLVDATREQQTTIDRLGAAVAEASDRALYAGPKLENALESIFLFGAEQRRLVQELRNQSLELAPRAAAGRKAADRVRRSIEQGDKIDRALFMLSKMGPSGANRPKPQVVAATVGEARAAQEHLRRELTELQDELGALERSLEDLAQTQPEVVADLDARATQPLTDLMDELVRVLDLASRSMRTIQRSAKRMNLIAHEARDGLVRASRQLPALATAVAQVGIDGSFETTLIEWLRRAQAEAEPPGARGMSAAGLAMLADVDSAADAARGRLAELIETTEASLSVLRVG